MGMQKSLGRLAVVAVLASGMVAGAQKAQLSDAQVEANVLKALAADGSLTNQPIQSSTAFGVVTLTGAVSDEASRDRAESIASRTNGVKKVVDQMTVGAQAVAAASQGGGAGAAAGAGANSADYDPASRNVLPGNGPAQADAANGNQQPNAMADTQGGVQQQDGAAQQQPAAGTYSRQGGYNQQQGAPGYAQQPQGYPMPGQGDGQVGSQPQQQPVYSNNGGQYSANNQYPPQGGYQQGGYPQGQYPQGQQGQYPPPPPNGRLYRRDWERQQAQRNGGYAPQGQGGGQPVTVPAGVVLPVRVTRWIDSRDAQPGSQFVAVVNNDILSNGLIAIPRGAEVQGTVVDAKGAGVLKGRGELTLQLNSLMLGGRQYPLISDTFRVNGHDKTARSVNSTIIGGALGALIGAAAGGGTGAAIGAGVGGAAGLGTSAASHSGNVDIPAEALLQFRLDAPLPLVTVSEAEMQRLGNFAGPNGARQPMPPPGYGYRGPGPYGVY